ncbi:MAG: hypothetical protein LBL07_03855 [Tannerella sp.]|jgi:hypothetical protein|nr:hypothetical protein [Tannerella sp.]
MENYLGKEYTDRDRRESFLKANCEKVEEKGYMKPYTPEELQGHKENLANLSIRIEEVEEEKKAQERYYKDELDPLTKERSEMVKNIRQKAEYVHEICYKFVDREEKQTGYYNADGDLIELRPATADELHPTLFIGLPKTGTDSQ